MFSATVFMNMRCDDVVYCLKTARPREFFFPPEKGTRLALEENIGNSVVITDVKQSVIPDKESGPSRQGVTISVDCLRPSTEIIVNSLAETGRWAFVINSSFVFNENGEPNEARTEKLRQRLRESKNARYAYSNRRR